MPVCPFTELVLAAFSYAPTCHLEVGLFVGFQHYRYVVFQMPIQPGFNYGEYHHTAAPTSSPTDFWDEKSYETPHSDIITFTVNPRAYLIPDASASVLFLLHTRKRPQNNFVVGLCGYLSFVIRMSIYYNTLENQDIPLDLWTRGQVEWNSSTIGIIVGYRFMGLKP